MKYKNIIHSIAFAFSFLTIVSCNDALYNDILSNDKNSQAATRTLANETDYYYWYNGEKIEISSVRNLYYLSSLDSLKLESIQFKSKAIAVDPNVRSGNLIEKEKYYWKIVELKENSTSNDSISIASELGNEGIYVAPVFGKNEQNYVATSEYFYVKTKSKEDYLLLKNIAKEQFVEIIKEIDYMPNWYLLKAPISSNGLSMSNFFHETGKFENVDPAFMFNFKPTDCPSEPDFSKQWGLNKMELCNTWDITKGKSDVIVAVLDQGVDKNHKEFANNYSSLSYDIINGSSPSVVRGNHGTHVGGIIGANHNNIQIAGVAPQSTILSISHSLSITPTKSSQLATGISYARTQGAAVINNSWGDQGGYFQELHSSILEDAINTAIKSGRNGKGMVVVFAAGNQNIPTADYPASFSPDILVVGSIDNSNKRSSFSSYGTCVDVVAPGTDIWSTLPNNSTGYMSGTSMAAPHVTGLAALIISINPNLTGKEVVNIIEKTAQKVGSYSYTTTPSRSNGTWNNEMGYGLCNAFAAISVAEGNIVTFNNQTVSSNQTITGWVIQSENVTVTNGAKLTFNAGESVTINTPFTVNAGSQIDIFTY